MPPIRLLLSDVDGTLVNKAKEVTPVTRAAVKRLAKAGIGFTITSSRPPFGLRYLVDALDLKLPLGAYNGGALVNPDLSVVEQRFVPEAAAREGIAMMEASGASIWVYTGSRWLVKDRNGPHVDHEAHTIATEPTVVEDFGNAIARAGKIVGVSDDHDMLAACEAKVKAALGSNATVARSQHYYLDITPPGVDKATTLRALSAHLNIPVSQIAAIGDMNNDLPMLSRAGMAIAMGNGSEDVKQVARFITRSNEEDGLAYAVDEYLLKTDED